MKPEQAQPIPLELPTPRGAVWAYPWWGLAVGSLAGVLVGHPVAMLVQNFQDTIRGHAALAPIQTLSHTFQAHMWPMMLLYALVGGAFCASLGYIFQRLEENRRLIQVLHHEFEFQVATLRHHYKNLALGIRGFSQRIRRKAADLEDCLARCSQRDCPLCVPLREDLTTLERDVAVLDDTAQRLTATLGHELLFLRALTGEVLTLEHRDFYPLLQTAVRDLLTLRFRDKDLKVEINGQPWEECRDSLTFSFEPYAMEVMVQNLLSNAMKYGDHILLGVEEKGNRVRLTVEDNGPGMEVEKLKSELTTPGGRREDSTQLGLRVSLHLLAKVGGHLWVASAPRAGATFTLEIPKHRSGRQG